MNSQLVYGVIERALQVQAVPSITWPKPRCEVVRATEPTADFAVGNLIGMAQSFGPWIVIGGLALLVLLALTKWGQKLGKGVIVTFFLVLLLGAMIAGGASMFGSTPC